MFYLTNSKGRFFAGYVPAGERYVRMFEGSQNRGVTRKLERTALTTEDAWEYLCEEVVKARADGYRPAPIEASIVEVPDKLYQGEIPFELRGVYAHVQVCTEEHFAAGLTKLQEVRDVLATGGVQITLEGNDRSVRLALGKTSLYFGLADLNAWETMSTKARELCEERGIVNGTHLLPSGKGLWHMQTCESELDLCVRAFMAGAIEAGAVIRFTADQEWAFTAERAFHSTDVGTLKWYQENPGALDLVHGLAPRTTQVSLDDSSDMFLFL